METRHILSEGVSKIKIVQFGVQNKITYNIVFLQTNICEISCIILQDPIFIQQSPMIVRYSSQVEGNSCIQGLLFCGGQLIEEVGEWPLVETSSMVLFQHRLNPP